MTPDEIINRLQWLQGRITALINDITPQQGRKPRKTRQQRLAEEYERHYSDEELARLPEDITTLDHNTDPFFGDFWQEAPRKFGKEQAYNTWCKNVIAGHSPIAMCMAQHWYRREVELKMAAYPEDKPAVMYPSTFIGKTKGYRYKEYIEGMADPPLTVGGENYGEPARLE